MQSDKEASDAAPTFTFSGLRLGAAAMLPLLPGGGIFGAAFGTVAAQKGLTLVDATLMSAIVFAGASQLTAMAAASRPDRHCGDGGDDRADPRERLPKAAMASS